MGDWEIYSFMASEDDRNPYDRAFKRWKTAYGYLGYAEIPDNVWLEAGGYGVPYDHWLRKYPIAIDQ